QHCAVDARAATLIYYLCERDVSSRWRKWRARGPLPGHGPARRDTAPVALFETWVREFNRLCGEPSQSDKRHCYEQHNASKLIACSHHSARGEGLSKAATHGFALEFAMA